ncbi:MAG: hypothetical protein LBI63_00825 [Candidatus Ancillula sp.]|jgi:hypothetical protein|nr:hypothetical protein [Candidatus Ancillula sp.]
MDKNFVRVDILSILRQPRVINYLFLIFIIVVVSIRILSAVFLGGGFGDESARIGAIEALLSSNKHMIDMHSLFAIRTDADYSTFPFFAPFLVVVKLFGANIHFLRAFMQLLTTASIFLLAKSISYFADTKRQVHIFRIMLIVGLLLPWNFLQGSIFWDTAISPIYFIIAFFSFSYLYNSENSKINKLAFICMPTGLVLGATSYKAFALTALLLWIVFVVGLFRKNVYNIKHIILITTLSFLIAIPFIYLTLFIPDFTSRASVISVFAHSTSFTSALIQIFDNFLNMISPIFLFMIGDPNRMHAIGVMGMLLPVSIIPLVILLYKVFTRQLDKQMRIPFWISVAGIFTTNLMCATTFDGQMHSLRSSLSWLFWTVLISIGYFSIERRFLVLHIICAAVYITIFFFNYIPKSGEYFHDDPPYTLYYDKIYYDNLQK